nr:transcription initiation factor TFIID subunit 8 [Tanacetum cinerariifolium]GEW26806.1 transcription initiation factor TFIID subunit 8 [Tanacetum cinerariifolium]
MNNGYVANSDEYGRAIGRVAVAQICQRVGFRSFSDNVLEGLADLALRYVKDLAKTAKFYANVANRTECNVFDVIQSLEDLGSDIGYPGGSEKCRCLVGSFRSGVVREVMEYVKVVENVDVDVDVQFAQPVVGFPVFRDKKVRQTPSFMQMGETPEFKHVPEWLPAFPDPHTYVHTPVWNERTSDPRADKVELARQRRKAESSLLSLQKRLLNSGSGVGVASTSGAVKERKNVSEFDTENGVSILETFAPVVEALSSRVSESGEDGEPDFLDKRPAVRLNFNHGRKMIGDSLDLRLWNRGTGRISSWFGRDDVMDEKKRRAEYILRQSMENPLDLAHL